MPSDWEFLKITASNLTTLSGLEINDIFVGNVFRPSALRKPQTRLLFLLGEVSFFCIILTFAFVASLVILRNFGGPGSNMVSNGQILRNSFGSALLVSAGWNVCVWIKVRDLRCLVVLLDEIDRFNAIVKSVEVRVSSQLEPVDLLEQPFTATYEPAYEMVDALRITRTSLVTALQVERLHRQHRRLAARRYELFTHIEDNLLNLKLLVVSDRTHEHEQLLQEVLQVNINAHREVQKLQKRRLNSKKPTPALIAAKRRESEHS